MKVDQLTKFISNYAYSSPKKGAKIVFSELSEKRYKCGQLCSPKRSVVCLILFVDSRADSILEDFKPLIEAH